MNKTSRASGERDSDILKDPPYTLLIIFPVGWEEI
jgi:hypothetical protein